jgi:thiosulfate dehydrogenase [quinone] large subunit
MTDFEWKPSYLKTHKLKASGVIAILALRYLYTSLFIYGFVHKIMRDWMWSDILTQHFTKRLHELLATNAAPGSIEATVALWQASYLEHFALPLVMPIAWIVTIGELIIGVALLLGVSTRLNAAFGLFMLLNFAAGGYYNLTIPPLVTISILLILLPTGHWLGLDRRLNRKYPESPWFK